MAVFLVVIAAFLLIGAVAFGLIRNNKASGKPTQGEDSDGTPRPSS